MTNELNKSFETVKGYMTEDNNGTVPTDRQVWEDLKSTAEQRIEEAIADDMEGSTLHWQKRLKAINEQLEAIHYNELAEQNRVITMYQQGLRHY